MISEQLTKVHSDTTNKWTETARPEATSPPDLSAAELLQEVHTATKLCPVPHTGSNDGSLTFSDPYNSQGKTDIAAPDASKVAAPVFKDPGTFLTVLKNDFNDISGGKDTMSLGDLLNASKNSKDPLERAATAIAADHFDALTGITVQKDNNLYAQDRRDNWLSL
jgi:hypothetical protein